MKMRNMAIRFTPCRIALALLTGTCAMYLVQAFSPLRINNDSVSYLHMARSIWQGDGPTILGDPSFLPSGYPALLSLVHEIGLATPFIFVFLNIVFLFAGALFFYRLFRQAYGLTRFDGLLVVSLTALSFVALKHTVLTVSEAAYLFFSAIALSFVHTADGGSRQRWVMLFFGAVVAAEAIWVRTVGIALIPAFLFAILVPMGHVDVGQLLKAKKTYVRLVPAAAVIVSAFYLARPYTSYDDALFNLVRDNVSDVSFLGTLATQLTWKLNEITQITLNVPISAVPNCLQIPFVMCGCIAGFFVVRGVCGQFSAFRALDLYFLSYAFIVLVWHSQDARFWLPVLPFVVMYLLRGLQAYSHLPLFRFGKNVWVSGYAAMGIVALAYSTHLTFSGPQFADRYGDGTYREVYRAAFFGPENADLSKVGERELAILQWYEPRTKNRN